MKIAVIGGIGSGKSYVLNLIAGFGERVCDCDAIYKEISVTDDYVKSIAKVCTNQKIHLSSHRV